MAGVLNQTKGIFASTQQSGTVGSAQSTFSRFKICFTSTPLTCGNNQINKISLLQFNAHKNWYVVNKFNSKFVVRAVKGGVEKIAVGNIPHQDYASIGDVATAFSNALKTILATADFQNGAVTFSATDQIPLDGVGVGETTKRSYKNKLTSSGTLLLSNIRVQFPQFRNPADDTDFNDSYILMGGKRITDSTDTATSSLKVTIASNDMTFQGAFPMVLHTQPYIYLSLMLGNDNLQTANLGNEHAAIDEHVTSSSLLAKIPIQDEYCSIQLDTSTPFFMTTSQRTVTELLFQALDSHGRIFPKIDDTGDGDNIETQGNLFSDMMIRHEVLDIGTDAGVLNAPFKTFNYQVNDLGQAQMLGGGGF